MEGPHTGVCVLSCPVCVYTLSQVLPFLKNYSLCLCTAFSPSWNSSSSSSSSEKATQEKSREDDKEMPPKSQKITTKEEEDSCLLMGGSFFFFFFSFFFTLFSSSSSLGCRCDKNGKRTAQNDQGAVLWGEEINRPEQTSHTATTFLWWEVTRNSISQEEEEENVFLSLKKKKKKKRESCVARGCWSPPSPLLLQCIGMRVVTLRSARPTAFNSSWLL